MKQMNTNKCKIQRRESLQVELTVLAESFRLFCYPHIHHQQQKDYFDSFPPTLHRDHDWLIDCGLYFDHRN